jgi:hypothetical protein
VSSYSSGMLLGTRLVGLAAAIDLAAVVDLVVVADK